MKINKITLENIGPYIDTNTFDFTVSNNKNIILIGGKNGSGKTSLLKSIKYGLFGPFCLGLKNDSKKYYEEIINLINTDNGNNRASIAIHITVVEELNFNNYIIKRTWLNSKSNIDESIEIIKNDEELTDYDALEFIERLKSFTSPQLINSIIFDGEEIGNIIQQDGTKSFLKETFESLFNINLINQLSNDLTSYLEKRSQEGISSKEMVAYNLISDTASLKGNIKVLEEDISSIKSKLNELNSKIKAINKEFTMLGGLTKNQQKILIDELSTKSKEVEASQKEFRNFVENDLCFSLNMKLMKKAAQQLEKEIPLRYLNNLKDIEKYLGIDSDVLSKVLQNKIEINNVIHDLDAAQIEKYNIRYNGIVRSTKKAKDYVMIKEDENSKISVLKNLLIKQEDIDRFDDLVSESENLKNNVFVLEQALSIKIKKLDELQSDFSKKVNQLDFINNEIRKTTTYDNSFLLASRTIEVNRLFSNYLIETKLDDVSKLAVDIFSETIRKENYIKNIIIDSDYTISLFDYNDNEMKIKTLSAGEMQLLVSSIIWAMFKVSGRNETFVFDTPLARLDVENRISFINNIIKTISSQVIVLSTDSEIVGVNFDAISSNTSTMYRLDYIESTKSTKISKGYF